MAVFHHRCHLLGRLRQDDSQRQAAIGDEGVGFEGNEFARLSTRSPMIVARRATTAVRGSRNLIASDILTSRRPPSSESDDRA
jgi:hypothetical protein